MDTTLVIVLCVFIPVSALCAGLYIWYLSKGKNMGMKSRVLMMVAGVLGFPVIAAICLVVFPVLCVCLCIGGVGDDPNKALHLPFPFTSELTDQEAGDAETGVNSRSGTGTGVDSEIGVGRPVSHPASTPAPDLVGDERSRDMPFSQSDDDEGDIIYIPTRDDGESLRGFEATNIACDTGSVNTDAGNEAMTTDSTVVGDNTGNTQTRRDSRPSVRPSSAVTRTPLAEPESRERAHSVSGSVSRARPPTSPRLSELRRLQLRAAVASSPRRVYVSGSPPPSYAEALHMPVVVRSATNSPALPRSRASQQYGGRRHSLHSTIATDSASPEIVLTRPIESAMIRM